VVRSINEQFLRRTAWQTSVINTVTFSVEVITVRSGLIVEIGTLVVLVHF